MLNVKIGGLLIQRMNEQGSCPDESCGLNGPAHGIGKQIFADAFPLLRSVYAQ